MVTINDGWAKNYITPLKFYSLQQRLLIATIHTALLFCCCYILYIKYLAYINKVL